MPDAVGDTFAFVVAAASVALVTAAAAFGASEPLFLLNAFASQQVYVHHSYNRTPAYPIDKLRPKTYNQTRYFFGRSLYRKV